MEPLEAIRLFRAELASQIGRHIYAFVGDGQALELLEGYLGRLRTPQKGLPLPGITSLNRVVLERIPQPRLEALARREALQGTAIYRELSRSFQSFVHDYFSREDILIIKDFELLFRYGVELGLQRSVSIDRRHTALLIPGRRNGDRIFAYARGGQGGWEFYPGLAAPQGIWEVEVPEVPSFQCLPAFPPAESDMYGDELRRHGPLDQEEAGDDGPLMVGD
jgi:hypothetical protein